MASWKILSAHQPTGRSYIVAKILQLFTPDEAALQVLCVLGRWFAVWTDPEEPPAAPAWVRIQIARIEVSREDPCGHPALCHIVSRARTEALEVETRGLPKKTTP